MYTVTGLRNSPPIHIENLIFSDTSLSFLACNRSLCTQKKLVQTDDHDNRWKPKLKIDFHTRDKLCDQIRTIDLERLTKLSLVMKLEGNECLLNSHVN